MNSTNQQNTTSEPFEDIIENAKTDKVKKSKYDVFISYSNKNKNVADAICANFEQNQIKCWYAPRDIMPGESWPAAIKAAIHDSSVFVLIFSEDSNESKQVMSEVSLAFNAEKTMIPFKISETQMSDELEYFLSRYHWLDAVSESQEKKIDELRKYTEQILKHFNKSVHIQENSASQSDIPTAKKENTKVNAEKILTLLSHIPFGNIVNAQMLKKVFFVAIWFFLFIFLLPFGYTGIIIFIILLSISIYSRKNRNKQMKK